MNLVDELGYEEAKALFDNVPNEYRELSPTFKSVAVNKRGKYIMTAPISKKKTEVYLLDLKVQLEEYEKANNIESKV